MRELIVIFLCLSIATAVQAGEPNAEFSWEQLGLEVSFTDETPLDINLVEWYWDFGDGTHSSEQNPVHTYPGYGNYTVSLKVWNAEGYSNIQSKIIWVNPNIQAPSFSMSYLVALTLIFSGLLIIVFGRLPSVRIGGAFIMFFGTIMFVSQTSQGISLKDSSPFIIYGIPLLILTLITASLALSKSPYIKIALAGMFVTVILVMMSI